MTVYALYYFLVIVLSISNNVAGMISDHGIRGTSNLLKRKATIVFLVVSLIAIIGFRHPSMGVDLGYGNSFGYLASFDSISNYSWLESINLPSFLNYEKGYLLFNKLVGSIIPDRQFFLLVCACIAIIPFGYIIYRKSRFPYMSIVVYLGIPVFLISFSGLRQSLAIAVTFYALKYIQKKKLIPFILIVLLASTLHFSAIVFILAYPIYYWKKNRIAELISVLFIPLVYLLRYPLFSLLSRVLRGSERMPDDNASFVLFMVFIMIYLFTLVFKKQKTTEFNGYSNLFYFACLTQAFSGVYSTAMRVGYYFMIFLTLLLPEMLWGIQTKENWRHITLVRWGISIVFIAFGLYSIYRSSWAMAYPYMFFWE